MSKKYKEVVVERGRVKRFEHTLWVGEKYWLSILCGKVIREGDYVQVIYRYAKKPWGNNK